MNQQSEQAPVERKPKKPLLRWVLLLLAILAFAILGWCRWVYIQIQHYAAQDQAAPSNAIAVFGAAEYDGHPSPVFRARLDHAESLYNRGIAPLIITLGGDGGDQYSEGAVGQQYLKAPAFPSPTSSPRQKAPAPTSPSNASPSSPAPTVCIASSWSATARISSAFTRSAPPTASMC